MRTSVIPSRTKSAMYATITRKTRVVPTAAATPGAVEDGARAAPSRRATSIARPKNPRATSTKPAFAGYMPTIVPGDEQYGSLNSPYADVVSPARGFNRSALVRCSPTELVGCIVQRRALQSVYSQDNSWTVHQTVALPTDLSAGLSAIAGGVKLPGGSG